MTMTTPKVYPHPPTAQDFAAHGAAMDAQWKQNGGAPLLVRTEGSEGPYVDLTVKTMVRGVVTRKLKSPAKVRAILQRLRMPLPRVQLRPVAPPVRRAQGWEKRTPKKATAPPSSDDPAPSDPDPPVIVRGLRPLTPDQIHAVARRLAALLITGGGR